MTSRHMAQIRLQLLSKRLTQALRCRERSTRGECYGRESELSHFSPEAFTRFGVKVRIIDKTAEPSTTSRAIAVQARTLELYRPLDLADAVTDKGHKVPAVNLWAEGDLKAHLDFPHIGADLTRYSFLQIFPQDEHERLLIDRLRKLAFPSSGEPN